MVTGERKTTEDKGTFPNRLRGEGNIYDGTLGKMDEGGGGLWILRVSCKVYHKYPG